MNESESNGIKSTIPDVHVTSSVRVNIRAGVEVCMNETDMNVGSPSCITTGLDDIKKQKIRTSVSL